ncbi:enoyl-CoA hydratase/isomerase family protein [Motiliproteus sediminis]|uniref:enoyl-CoA hydratase/isomerase family protein n=1 Tax=Motiliproteus sediminis TaxID=1468178 RepID=UPI001AEF5E1D|nr:enoyl-CoA hydratase-related protein [Motiliproteus sediminis]
MTDLVQYQTRGAIAAIVLNRADKKNALTVAMYQRLLELLQQADADESIRAIHITGSGDSFSAGNDISDFIAAGQQAVHDNPALRLLHQLHRQRKPLVAAVNGVAVGIGTTLLLHCDFAYAAQSARFKLPFVDLGLVPEGGSSSLLPQMLGHRRAAELLLACESFGPDEAESYGILNGVCADDQLLATSWAMAERLATKPPQALQQAKAMLKANSGRPLAEVIDSEVEEFMRRLSSPEALQALSAFVRGKG